MESNLEIISPYAFPGIRLSDLDPLKYPYLFDGLRRLTEEQVLKVIADETNVDLELILTKCRKRNIVYSRNIFQKILRIYGDNLKKIANTTNTDHTTVIHSIKTFDEQYELDENYRASVNRIFTKIGIKIKTLQTK
jgi:chromosomal replication initiation ATPase DnaA